MLQAAAEQSYPDPSQHITGDPAEHQEEELVPHSVQQQPKANVRHCLRGEGEQSPWSCLLYLCHLLGSVLHHEPGGGSVWPAVRPAWVHGRHGFVAGLRILYH